MKSVAIVGAGRIGTALGDMLGASGDYRVTLIDKSEAALLGADMATRAEKRALDITDKTALVDALEGKFAVISAAPYQFTTAIAEAAAEARVHYIDLTEDVASTRRVKQIAETADTAFIPQCGLAPGFITIAAHSMARAFDEIETVRMRVGALPQYPSNALNYNLTWSPEGVINEYCEPCEAIVGGELREVPALEEREEFSIDGVTYEAFNTSGGLGSLCETLKGRVRDLNYRTIRYPGHAAIMKTLLRDLRLGERRDLLKDIFEHALPTTQQDVVVIFVTVTGRKNGQLVQETYANKVYPGAIGGKMRSAIQRTTSAGASTVLDMLAKGQLPQKGYVQQEDIALDAFLANRFGQVFDGDAEGGEQPERSVA